MALTEWFKRAKGAVRDKAPEEERELGIEELIVLERYDEAEQRLQAELKRRPKDLHAHLKLAEVYTQLRQAAKAADEYVFVAEEYAQDGFYDKGIALLAKAARLAPLEDSLPRKIETLKLAKNLEHKQRAALEGLRQGAGGGAGLEVQRVWHHLARGSVIQGLPEDQVRRLFSGLTVSRRPAGSELAAEGSPGEELHLIARGVVEAITLRADGEEVGLRTFGAGDILGERVLFEHRPWPATYRVTEEALLLTLSREGVERSLVGNSDPRGLLEALRWQSHDRTVADMVRKMKARS